jgi:hypothetical protein
MLTKKPAYSVYSDYSAQFLTDGLSLYSISRHHSFSASLGYQL